MQKLRFCEIETPPWKTRLLGLEICVSPNSLENVRNPCENYIFLTSRTFLGKVDFLDWKLVFLQPVLKKKQKSPTRITVFPRLVSKSKQSFWSFLTHTHLWTNLGNLLLFHLPRFIFCKCDHSIFVEQDARCKFKAEKKSGGWRFLEL